MGPPTTTRLILALCRVSSHPRPWPMMLAAVLRTRQALPEADLRLLGHISAALAGLGPDRVS